MTLQLCWLRNDLRAYDNIALDQAMQSGPVVALYIATPGQWQIHDEAPVKLDFWRRNLEVLENVLAQKGVPLVYHQCCDYGDIPAVLDKILSAWPVDALHFNREYPLNEWQRDEAVRDLCRQRGTNVFAWQDQVLLAPDSVRNKSGEPFRVFTPFSRRARELLGNSPCVYSTPDQSVSKRELPVLAEIQGQCFLEDIAWPAPQKHWSSNWPAGERYAGKLLGQFCQHRINAYRQNRDQPALDGTSRLSAYLSAGVISVRECWRQSEIFAAGEGVHTWQNELLWRDFYRHIMYHYPHVCMSLPWKRETDAIAWRHDREEFDRWCQGQTGFPIIDAAMRQLLQTGWMHNRLRMIVAMFLSKHLLLDWRWGELWFMQHLVDGDFASNNGGWQWSASTGTDAVPYFRIFNPLTQSRRFDPDGEFIRRYVPELADMDNVAVHEPGVFKPNAYPAPMIDLKFGRERALAAFKKR